MINILKFLLILVACGCIYVSSTDPRGFGNIPHKAFQLRILTIEEKK